ncbi:acyl-CoA synthetase (AMP-forming)/AMP-acid ligase II [Kitasatospora sp. SolWspMP-SS2h]|uniref:fatty acyl-AMP ligase n=1 Tax=Kitasatospora sp. SolWspMP-SS2h TaxID=1305729 RepID=UPI000DBF5B0B|nr:fatty acyl-AMP ligase [Kitasatospora sp. SolWspMP-SS2h]RAJ36135.1 acyl-CoA synthetase (AMP-forming)/AMP-acid ligase II [Kitasatospora sp. SolWspMP-SS2h]
MTTATRPGPDVLGDTRTTPTTLSTMLRRLAEHRPEDTAHVFLQHGERPDAPLTHRRYDRAARRVAAAVRRTGETAAVLLFPAGPDFPTAFLGCTYAAVAGAPVQVPTRPRGVERVRRIADDAGTSLVLTTAATRDEVLARFGALPELDGLHWLAVDELAEDLGADWEYTDPGLETTALLQYTSGSTGHPKGVAVSHRNFWHQAVELDRTWPIGPDGRIVSWLPSFHDMGLLFGVVLPLWSGAPVYQMAPEAFIRRPGRWLEALSTYRGTHAAAPNFAYELCRPLAGTPAADGLDLSAWRAAVCGAEPVRWATARGFQQDFARYGLAPEAISPGYGLAENTLKVSGSPSGRAPRVTWLSAEALRRGHAEPVTDQAPGAVPVVGCGPVAEDSEVRIVDPVGRVPLPEGSIGEIWVRGPSVAKGYHRKPALNREVFRARLAGTPEAGPFLRTGDLGFLLDGELHPTGRVKDLIVIGGGNHYPQDIEQTVEHTHPGLHTNAAAAFAVDHPAGEQLVVVVEADGRVLRNTTAVDLADAIRTAIGLEHQLTAAEVVPIRRGSLPRTTSGKVQRTACRQAYLDGTLHRLA